MEHIVAAAIRIESEAEGLAGRQALLREIDAAGIVATPANSRYNELVTEAGRLPMLNGGRESAIEYGDQVV